MATLGNLTFDVIEQEKPNFVNTITDKPVEDGANISDHIRNEPTVLNLKAIFSGDEAMDKYTELLDMKNSEELYPYSGGLGTYKNLAIKSISPMKDASYGDGYECSIVLKQVRVVELKTVEITLGVDPGTGEQVQSDTSEDETDEKTSEEEEVDEESADPTSLKVFWNVIKDNFGNEDGEEE